ncbi:MAG: exosortase system-associated protein, TIGR04073 family [Deltaproteobacteria bacterium]|nr:MAG: exosortase system-associated protein, TIGR04073 family [Deltaproteobacteria bacterium]
MRKISFAVVAIIACLVLSAGTALAKKTVDNSAPQEIVDGMSNKLVRGVANVATGWIEFPKQIVITFMEDGVAKGIFVGPLKGVGMTLVRTGTGVIETATFFVPAPGFYEPLFSPEYVWQREHREHEPLLGAEGGAP